MKVFTKNEFSIKQRMILEMLATSPIESKIERDAAYAYWLSCNDAVKHQLEDLGGMWYTPDLLLLATVAHRIMATCNGSAAATRKAIDGAMLQMAELHPALGRINPDFIE
jgi:hypothetical protein